MSILDVFSGWFAARQYESERVARQAMYELTKARGFADYVDKVATLTPPALVNDPKLVIEPKRPAPYIIGVYRDRNGYRYKTFPMYNPANWDDFLMWAYLSGNIVLYRINIRPKVN